ncbi:MAG: cytochrome c type bioproteinis protein, partial [Ignavibacteria bacterium]
MKKVGLLIVLLQIVGCSAITLEPGAEKVRIVRTEPGKECEYLGEVTGDQGDWLTGAFTSNSSLETGALNDLKNKAAKMGGNLVCILTNRAGSTTDQSS